MIFGKSRQDSSDQFALIIFPDDFELTSNACVIEGSQYQQVPEDWKTLIWSLYYIKTLQTLGAGPHADGLKQMLELWADASIDEARKGFPNGSNRIDPEIVLMQQRPYEGEQYSVTVTGSHFPPTIKTKLARGGNANRLAYSVVALAEHISTPRAPTNLPAFIIDIQAFHATQQHYSKLSSIGKAYARLVTQTISSPSSPQSKKAKADNKQDDKKEAIFSCPKCGQKHRSLEKRTGTTRCKKCNHKFIVSTETDIPTVQEIPDIKPDSPRRGEALDFPPELGKPNSGSGWAQKQPPKPQRVKMEDKVEENPTVTKKTDNKNNETGSGQVKENYKTSSRTNESEELKASPPHNWQSSQGGKATVRKAEPRSKRRLIITILVLALVGGIFVLATSKESPSTSPSNLTESQLIQIQSQIKISVGNNWSKNFSFGVDPTSLGVAMIRVEVRDNGTVENVRVVESSGDTVFDDSAISAVFKAAPFNLEIKTHKSNAPLVLHLKFRPTK